MQSLAAVLALVGAASAFSSTGFTLSHKNNDGSCKNLTQWTETFQALQALPASTTTTGNITSARIFSSSECNNTVMHAAEAAMALGNQSILVGIWTTDAAHFTNETKALNAAIARWGDAWLKGVAVGSEDLWRKANNVSNLVSQIKETRAMLRAMESYMPVGHIDDYSAWIEPANAAVINASDFIGTNIHPYFESTSIKNANASFWASLLNVQGAVAHVKNITLKTTQPKKSKAPAALTPESFAEISQYVWVTETGYAVSGPTFGEAIPSAEAAATYWKAVACEAANKSLAVYWPADHDVGMVTSFGAFDATGVNQFVSAC